MKPTKKERVAAKQREARIRDHLPTLPPGYSWGQRMEVEVPGLKPVVRLEAIREDSVEPAERVIPRRVRRKKSNA